MFNTELIKAAHFIQHTVQVDKTLIAIGQAPSESKRLIRYLFAALAEAGAYLIGKNNSQEGCLGLAKVINSRAMEIKSVCFISVETVPKVGTNDQIFSTKPSGRSFCQLI